MDFMKNWGYYNLGFDGEYMGSIWGFDGALMGS